METDVKGHIQGNSAVRTLGGMAQTRSARETTQNSILVTFAYRPYKSGATHCALSANALPRALWAT
ncbi:hypothetical protein B8V09_00410 [Streptococcus agalactiae]|nr:hypothetical protein B8V09_00410 [Streptococcus agalactiae]